MCNNVDDSQKHAEQKKLGTKEYIVHDFIYRILRNAKGNVRKQTGCKMDG